jgi:hypothetical protein
MKQRLYQNYRRRACYLLDCPPTAHQVQIPQQLHLQISRQPP